MSAQLYTQEQLDIDKDLGLFVFLCPENTFVNHNTGNKYLYTHGVYTKDDYDLIHEEFSAFAKNYPNAIIIPGTASIYQSKQNKKEQCTEQQLTYENKEIFYKIKGFLFFGNDSVKYTKRHPDDLDYEGKVFIPGHKESIVTVRATRHPEHSEGSLYLVPQDLSCCSTRRSYTASTHFT